MSKRRRTRGPEVLGYPVRVVRGERAGQIGWVADAFLRGTQRFVVVAFGTDSDAVSGPCECYPERDVRRV
jgi:hypothetical protein